MKKHALTFPEIGLVAGTRLALGVGVGLLLSGRLAPDVRRAVGWGLLAVGVLSSPPLLARVLSRGAAEPAPKPATPPMVGV